MTIDEAGDNRGIDYDGSNGNSTIPIDQTTTNLEVLEGEGESLDRHHIKDKINGNICTVSSFYRNYNFKKKKKNPPVLLKNKILQNDPKSPMRN